MYTLKNAQLGVSLLDPITDQKRLGSRYCTGGYIYQVTDAEKGELLAGPHYPAPDPNVFDGQGAPDMFQTALMPGEVAVGGTVGCIGVGLVRRSSSHEPFDVRFNPEVIEFLTWEVNQIPDSIRMTTRQTFRDWAYNLTRTVTLEGRKVVSKTAITSQGTADLPVRWFAHPFFPLTPDQVLCKFSLPLEMPENPGYYYNADGFICRKADFDWTRGGYYQPFHITAPGSGFKVVEKHPKVGQVTAETDFMPTFLPIWGNANTFSFEPYFIRSLGQGQSAEWSITYQF
jgi:hypothetical protein